MLGLMICLTNANIHIERANICPSGVHTTWASEALDQKSIYNGWLPGY